MRRAHYIAVFLVLFGFSFYYFAPSTSSLASVSFFSSNDPCPNPLDLRPIHEPLHKPICRSLETHQSLDAAHALKVELCLSSKVPNHGTIKIERTDKDACATSEAIPASTNPLSDVKLKAKGPDVFHVRIDGEQRFVSETEVQYLGQCTYMHSFRLATAAPFNLTILWPFEDYRAALETSELATQYDKARPVLAGTHLIINSPSSALGHCPPVGAIATSPQWRSPALAQQLEMLPDCSAYIPTTGVYLHPHHSEDPTQFFQRYTFQPSGCKWSNPIRFGASKAETTGAFKQRKVLFIGDSHARYAYDLLMDVYAGEWDMYLKTPPIKDLIKTASFGPAVFDFYWEPVLQEVRIDLNCSIVSKYDTVLLGAGQHNAILIPEDKKEHAHQYTLRAWEQLIHNLAQKFNPTTCPGQRMPKVVWMGNPARIVRMEPASQSTWLDARSSIRVRLYDEIAWDQFKTLPGAARVDMFAISQPFVNDFKDMLHMRHTDTVPALLQDVHEKIRPTEPAYMHLDLERSR